MGSAWWSVVEKFGFTLIIPTGRNWNVIDLFSTIGDAIFDTMSHANPESDK